MKTDRIILAGLALTALVSCNKEAAPADGGVFRTDEAYMNIRIAYADKGLTTRHGGRAGRKLGGFLFLQCRRFICHSCVAVRIRNIFRHRHRNFRRR